MKLIKKNLFSALIFAIIIAVSMIIYALIPYEKSDFDKLVMQCVISSEVLGFLNALVYNAVSSKKKLSLAAGGYTSSIIYVGLSVTVSVLFSIYYRHAEKTYLILFTIITAVFVIASILIYIIGKSTASNTAKVEKCSAAFKEFEYIMESICRDNENPSYRTSFEKISEAIKSCDQSSYVETDDKIHRCLQQLKDQMDSDSSDEKKVEAISEKIFALIKQRTSEVSGLKLGGI